MNLAVHLIDGCGCRFLNCLANLVGVVSIERFALGPGDGLFAVGGDDVFVSLGRQQMRRQALVNVVVLYQ